MLKLRTQTILSLIVPLALTVACASSNDGSDPGDDMTSGGTTTGDGTTTGTTTGDGTTTGTTTSGGTTTGTTTGDGTTTGGTTTGGTTTGGDGFVNEFAADWDALSTGALGDINQCLGFESDGTTYRVWTPDDPNANPKDENPCPGAGNTTAGDGSCNVPAGFAWKDSYIGNKACSCDAALGLDCTTTLLPGLVLGEPTDCGGLADVVDETPCGVEFETCMASDLPTACEYTTPKGCVCLEDKEGVNVWQCGSTNSWFDCGAGVDCPAAWPASIASGADIKVNCNDASCGGSPSCE